MSDSPAKAEPAVPEPETVQFSVPSEYVAALERLLPMANEEILIFDRDLKDGDWGGIPRLEMIRAFLIKHRRARLQIVVHDTTHIERYLPRLILLLKDLSHKMTILRTVGDGRNAWDGFVLVDGRHLIHRYHLDAMRGELSIGNPKKSAELRERLDDILAFTEPGIKATQLGL